MGQSIKFNDFTIDSTGVTVDDQGKTLEEKLSDLDNSAYAFSESADSGGNWYIAAKKYNNGLLECWGWAKQNASVGVNSANIGYKENFISSPVAICSISNPGDATPYIGTVDAGTEQVNIYYHVNVAGSPTLSYFAIGKWK